MVPPENILIAWIDWGCKRDHFPRVSRQIVQNGFSNHSQSSDGKPEVISSPVGLAPTTPWCLPISLHSPNRTRCWPETAFEEVSQQRPSTKRYLEADFFDHRRQLCRSYCSSKIRIGLGCIRHGLGEPQYGALNSCPAD